MNKRDTVLENLRSLFLGLTASSMFIPILGSEGVLLAFGIASGVFYGIKIEKDLSSTSLGLHRNDFEYAYMEPNLN